ncbi:MAG TPA: biotin/lipoyl-binding protein [Candidatus Methylomirabilis sp.]|nr:biotin/lipoyl-binding protein [Candidatus Methylomirabilis sp.]
MQGNGGEGDGLPRRRWRQAWWLGLVLIALFATGAYALLERSPRLLPHLATADTSRATSTTSKNGAGGVPVVAAAARKADVNVYLTGLGVVTPLNTVIVRTRVDGQLMNIRFKEGQLVHEGDLLAEIDPRPFEAQLTQ